MKLKNSDRKVQLNYACKTSILQAKLKDYTQSKFFGILVTALNFRILPFHAVSQ